eukprot:15307462-Alexandrium_andersonii.AAC.1
MPSQTHPCSFRFVRGLVAGRVPRKLTASAASAGPGQRPEALADGDQQLPHHVRRDEAQVADPRRAPHRAGRSVLPRAGWRRGLV